MIGNHVISRWCVVCLILNLLKNMYKLLLTKKVWKIKKVKNEKCDRNNDMKNEILTVINIGNAGHVNKIIR